MDDDRRNRGVVEPLCSMKKVPLLALLVPLMVGIILAEYVGWDILVPSLLASALLLLAAIGSMWLRDDKGLLFVVLLGCSFVSLGYALRLLQQPERSESHYVHYIPQPTEGFAPRTTAVLLLRDAPFEKGASARAVAEVLQVGYPAGNQIRWFDTEGKVQLFFPRGHQEVTTLQRGDTLLAQVPFRQPAAADSGHTFDYRRYLSRKGILRTAYLTPDNFIAIPSSQETFMRRADRGRFHLLDLLRKSGLETTEQSLASALLLGWGNDMEDEIKQQFRDAGITHLLCVSGLHVGIVAMLIGWMLYWMRGHPRWRWLRGLLQMLGLWAFVLLTGMAPSTCRAAIMFSFIIVGQILFYRSSTLASVVLSALVMLLIRPTLLFEVGFQLSYAAVLGILFIYNPLTRLIPIPDPSSCSKRWQRYSYWLLQSAWQLIALSTAAQLATAPLTLFYFHYFPTYFLIANLLVVPLASIMMATIMVVLICSGFPTLLSIVCGLLQYELRWVEWVTRYISSWPHASLIVSRFTLLDALLLALLVVLVAVVLQLWTPRYIQEKDEDRA